MLIDHTTITVYAYKGDLVIFPGISTCIRVAHQTLTSHGAEPQQDIHRITAIQMYEIIPDEMEVEIDGYLGKKLTEEAKGLL